MKWNFAHNYIVALTTEHKSAAFHYANVIFIIRNGANGHAIDIKDIPLRVPTLKCLYTKKYHLVLFILRL